MDFNFRIIGGNTKKVPKIDLPKKVEEGDEVVKYPIPEGVTEAHIRSGQLCFGNLLQMSVPIYPIEYLTDGNKRIIKKIKTQRGKFIELIPAGYISFPDWDGAKFTQVAFHIDNSTILFRPTKPSLIPTPITKRTIPF